MNKESCSHEELVQESHRLQQRVAELEAAEAVRQESEQRYRIINQTVSDYAFSFHRQPNGIFVLDWLTESFTTLTGYPVSDLLGRPNPFHTYIHPDDLDQVLQTLASMPPDAPATYEFRLVTKAGDVRWLRSSTRTVADATGQIVGFYGATQDITEQKRLAHELERERHRFMSGPVVVFTWAAAEPWPVEYVSPNVQQWGYAPSDFLNGMRSYIDIIHPEDVERTLAEGVAYGNAGVESFTQEYRLRYADGQVRWVSDSTVIERSAQREVTAWTGYILDITERKQAEKALHTRERQQAVVAELGQRALAGEDLTALMDQAVAEVAQTLDAAYCKVLELLPDDNAFVLRSGVGWHDGLVGTGIVGAELDSQAGYTLVSSEPVIVEDLRTETRFHGPPLLHAHGVVSGISVIIAGQPHPFGVLGVHTTARRTFSHDDVHFLQAVANVLAETIERKQAEEQVRRNEAWQRSLLQATQDAFISINRQGRIERFNPAAERIFGYAQAEVQGQKVNLLMPELYAHEHDSYIERFERTGEPHAIGRIRTVSAKRKNGAVFPIELSVTEVTTDGETEYGAFIRDISEKVQLQEQLVDRERLAAIGTTAATLAHEIGNPLNGMSLNMQLMQRRLAKAGEGLDARFVGYVGNMQHEITRLTNLLHEFRSVSRRQTFSFQPLNLVAVIQELLAVETPHYTERGVQVEHVMPDDLPLVQADADKLKQVCLNLCKNAVEAMPAGGRLTLRAHAAEEHVHLEVIDTGDGIPEGVNIFEPFATTKAEGTGLGLPIVQQIITGHGGTLSYTSTPGQGTTFTVVLPLSPPRAAP